MSKLIEKLQRIAQHSDGIFITGQALDDYRESNYFSNIIKKYPHYFSIIDIHRTKLLQLTQSFNDNYVPFKKVTHIVNPADIIQRVLWSEIILQDNNAGPFPLKYFKCGKYCLILDNMNTSPKYFYSLKKKLNFHSIITINSRISFFNSINIKSFSPFSPKKKWVNLHLDIFYYKSFPKTHPLSDCSIDDQGINLKEQELLDNFLKVKLYTKNSFQENFNVKTY